MVDDKRFATIRAELALRGISVARTCPQDGPQRFYLQRQARGWHVERLDTLRALEDLCGALSASSTDPATFTTEDVVGA